MAKTMFSGFEIDPRANAQSSVQVDGSAGGVLTNITKDTSVFRTGTGSLKIDSTASNLNSTISISDNSGVISRTLFARVYFNVTNLPSANAGIFGVGSSTTGLRAVLKTTGKIGLFNGVSQVGSDSSATISTGAWYMLELKAVYNATPAVTDLELRLDGITIATVSGVTVAGGAWGIGWINPPGVRKVINFDDFSMNDSTGAVNNSWCGAGKVVLLIPASDSAIGNWLNGAGLAGNLFDAINNLPPVGVADASGTTTSQIKAKTATLPTNYDANLTTYSAAGIIASDTITGVRLIVNHGEDPATGTKAGSAQMVSNPAISSVSFNFGNDSGAQASYPTGLWTYNFTGVAENPTVTLGTAPVARVTCTSGATSARAASVDFLGAYVDVSPAAAKSLIHAGRTQRNMLLRR